MRPRPNEPEVSPRAFEALRAPGASLDQTRGRNAGDGPGSSAWD